MSDVYIDDGDASVVYSGTWESFYSQRAYRNSEHSTKIVNSRATLTFTGVNVMVYGTVRGGEAPQSSYNLDGGDQTVFTGTPLPITQYSVLCYTSPILRNVQHTLVITYIGNSTNSFFLDRFTVVTNGAVSTNSSTSPGISTVASTSPTESSTTSSVSESRSSTASRSSSVGNTTLVTLRSSGSSSDVLPPSSSTTQSGTMDTNSGTIPPTKSRPTAAIIGAIAAVSIVIFVSVIFIWLARRRKQQESKSWTSSSSYESGGAAAEPASFTTPLPSEVTPEMNERPPVYALSEPPAYDADIGSVVQVQFQNDSRPLGTGPGLHRSGKS